MKYIAILFCAASFAAFVSKGINDGDSLMYVAALYVFLTWLTQELHMRALKMISVQQEIIRRLKMGLMPEEVAKRIKDGR